MILVVTPLPVEAEALCTAGLSPRHFRIAVGGHGKVQFALRTQTFINEKRPDLVICAGACGALAAGVKPLDVVIAESTVEHDFKLRFVRRPIPSFVGDPVALRLLKNYETEGFGLHFGAIASGDEDVVGVERAREIHSSTAALAVAWEGAGGARACLHAGVPFLEIRGVTDSANHAAVENFRINLPKALSNVAGVIQFLARGR
jgi:adenosylhomocysteine nucleosidase